MSFEGVSVWFACKLCKSFFLNADDFAYHKKKSHAQQFQNTKFIVFEEQHTSPPVSPPENWVSFLSPKEETRIHKKIISSPPPPTTTSVDCNPHNENIQSNRNEPCIEIEPERNTNQNDPRHNSKKDDVGKNSANNCVELNSNLNVDDQENGKNQSNFPPASTSADSALTDKKRHKLCLSKLKAPLKRPTNSLRRSTRKIQNLPTNNEALLESVVQSRNNPCVYLERLNLITIPNAPLPSPSSSTIPIPSQENDKSDTNHNNSVAKSAKRPKVKCENQENIVQRSSTFTSPPNAHNQTLHSTASISTTTPEAETTTKGHEPQLGDEFEVQVASRNEIQPNFIPSISNQNQSSVNELVLSSNPGDHNVYNNSDFHNPTDFELGPVLIDDNNEDNLVPVPNPTTEPVDFNNFGPFFELVKTEYVTQQYEIENNKFPANEDRDPFESVSQQMESSAELTSNLIAASSSSSDFQAEPEHTSQYCISCQKDFISIRELKAHNRSEHGTQYGQKNFKCPFPNCEAIRGNQYLLRMHLMQVHSNARPYNCLLPNCTMSFKTKHCRSTHMRRVHRKTVSSYQLSNNRLQTETINENVSHSNHHNDTEPEPETELTPETDSFRYCIPCKQSFVSLSERRNHYKMYHMTQEGRLLFSCPYPNCTTITSSQWLLKSHLIQVHSNARPFKCPQPTCKMSFKTTSSRNRYFKSHANTAKST